MARERLAEFLARSIDRVALLSVDGSEISGFQMTGSRKGAVVTIPQAVFPVPAGQIVGGLGLYEGSTLIERFTFEETPFTRAGDYICGPIRLEVE